MMACNCSTGLIAGIQMRPVFMGCCKLDIGAHHACWLLLQALFMTASVPSATNTTATKAITRGVFIVALRPRPVEFSWFKNEPTVNVLPLLRRSKSQTLLFASPRVSDPVGTVRELCPL